MPLRDLDGDGGCGKVARVSRQRSFTPKVATHRDALCIHGLGIEYFDTQHLEYYNNRVTVRFIYDLVCLNERVGVAMDTLVASAQHSAATVQGIDHAPRSQSWRSVFGTKLLGMAT